MIDYSLCENILKKKTFTLITTIFIQNSKKKIHQKDTIYQQPKKNIIQNMKTITIYIIKHLAKRRYITMINVNPCK